MKVLIADEHALFRDGLGLLIEQLDGSATILQASNFAQALKILDTEHKFDLIIIDLDMQDMVWEKGFDAIRAKAGDARLVVISASENVHNIRESLEKGASGYITKRAETKILSNALKLILDGGTYIPPVMLGKNLDDTPAKGKGKMLTNRQSQVLGLVAKGMSNKQIAYEMGVSEATVKLHINALLRAIGATNRTQAVIIAQVFCLCEKAVRCLPQRFSYLPSVCFSTEVLPLFGNKRVFLKITRLTVTTGTF